MREIKFRAWCDIDKMMYVNIETGIKFDDNSHYGFECFIEPPEGDYHKWTLEQFTGLKDKNGEEIYEGDIADHNVLRYVVQWSDVMGAWVLFDGEDEALLCNDYQVLERRGNINQNPELLK